MTRNATASTTADAEPLRRLREESPGRRFHRSERDSDDASLDAPPADGAASLQRRLRGRYSRGMSFFSHPPRGRAGPAEASAAGDMGAVSETETALAAAAAASASIIAMGRAAAAAFVGGLVWQVKTGFWLGETG